MANILAVRNIAQKVLVEKELQGQLSDGKWENATPHGHWKPWCEAEVVVSEKVGRNFSVRKDNYQLASKELLDVVGPRMTRYVQAMFAFGTDEAVELVSYLYDDLGNGAWRGLPAYPGEYWDKVRARIKAFVAQFGGLDAVHNRIEDITYGKKELVADLNDLKTIFKTRKLS